MSLDTANPQAALPKLKHRGLHRATPPPLISVSKARCNNHFEVSILRCRQYGRWHKGHVRRNNAALPFTLPCNRYWSKPAPRWHDGSRKQYAGTAPTGDLVRYVEPNLPVRLTLWRKTVDQYQRGSSMWYTKGGKGRAKRHMPQWIGLNGGYGPICTYTAPRAVSPRTDKFAVATPTAPRVKARGSKRHWYGKWQTSVRAPHVEYAVTNRMGLDRPKGFAGKGGSRS